MRKVLIIVLGVFFCVQAAGAQPKVAVLDASLGEGVHPNAAAIVADTINEQFVKSPDFIAIDRTYISSIQAEKAFQLSGEVNDADIKELGVTFGADYLCIANVSLLGSTYTVSARLIEVSSAQVTAQESHRKQGQIDVLFEVAEVVGSKFVGARPSETPAAQTAAASQQEPEPAPQAPETPQPEPAPTQAKPSISFPRPKGRITFYYFFPGYIGEDGNNTYSGDDYYSFYEQDQYVLDNYAFDDAWNTNWGIGFHILTPVNFFYFSFGANYSNQTMTATYDYYEYTYDIFSTIDATVGVGFIFSPLKNLQFYAGADIGYMLFILGSEYSGDAEGPYWEDDGETAGGILFGGEAGIDLFLGGMCVSLKYQLSIAPDLTGDDMFTDEYEEAGGDTSFGVHGLSIGIGFSM